MLVKCDLNYVLKGSFWQLDGEQAEEARMNSHVPGRGPRQGWFGQVAVEVERTVLNISRRICPWIGYGLQEKEMTKELSSVSGPSDWKTEDVIY